MIPLPEIQIQFDKEHGQFQPGDFLICEYSVSLNQKHIVLAIETSVIWQTEGKGDTDIGVHFFERRQRQGLTSDTFNQSQRLSTVLPASPHSYDGQIVKIHWGVRVRIFLDDGQQVTEDKFFKLGQALSAEQWESLEASESRDKTPEPHQTSESENKPEPTNTPEINR